MSKATKPAAENAVAKHKLTRAEKREIEAIIRKYKGDGKPHTAQDTIPYQAMHPDGICQIPGGLYTKTLEYEDINYAVASTEDQTAIISGWSACLNYFDSSLPFQLYLHMRLM